MDVASIIRDTLLSQAKGIEELADSFDESAFNRAVDLLFYCQGTVIVTGVGKSGNIAAKIASTLTSTGTRAICLDPIEALHGGLGFIRSDDVVIALSKSGETSELLDMLGPIEYLQVPIIAITCQISSTLARAARTVLVYSAVEGCGIDMIPTTSSTVALAIGDAIAIAVMKSNKFTLEQFSRFHPGGELGQTAKDSIGKTDFNATC